MAACARCRAELPPGARFCPACAAPVEAQPSSEERKLATVLFADLVGSTQLGEQDPERTRALLDRFYDAMAGEIAGAGGTVEKFAGDAVMAAFGAPTAQEDHAERALHAALSMLRRLDELFGDELALRIGVNTGEVVVGRPREGSSFVTGDVVNVAARLEQAASPGEILAGERTVAAVRGAFEFAAPQTVEAKGKPGGVACRRLVRALSLMRPRGIGGLREAFVGRESELALLQATHDRVIAQGEPAVVTIVGEAGVGKTRLVRELWGWLAGRSPQPLQRTGRCLPYGQATYWALGEVLKEHLGILENDPPEATQRRLGARTILGLTLGLDVAGDLHPLAARDRLHEEWVSFLTELAAAQPTVLLVEDLHWAEEPLLELLARIARDVRGPLLVIATARPELLDRQVAGPVTAARNSSVVWLEALSGDQTALMLEQLLATPLPAALRDVFVERAEGNPFFVEELLSSLIEQGLLERRGEGWSVAEPPAGFAVPDSVQAILAARIDLLEPPEKAALQAAAVIGRIFWPGPVSTLLDGAEADFAVLEARDFVRRRPGSSMAGEPEYAFKHALTREVAYGSLPKAKRARLHAAFARWLEQIGGRDEHASLLAHHYAEAVRPEEVDLAWAGEDAELGRLREQALVWLRRAAELAIGRYDLDEALAHLHLAAALAVDGRELSAIWREIGRANALKYDGEAFWTAMERSLEFAPDGEAAGDAYAELALQTATRVGMWKRMPARDLVDGWIERALELTGPETRARAKALIARAYWPDLTDGSEDAATGAAAEASALAGRLGEPGLSALAFAGRAAVANRAGRHDESLTWADRCADLIDEIRDPDLRAEVHYVPMPAAVALGRIREARQLAHAHEDALQTLTPHHRLHGVAIVVELEELAADWAAVSAAEERVKQRVADNLATPCVRNARTLLVCAAARAATGDEAGARALEEEADELGMEGYGMIVESPHMRLALIRGDLDRVERGLDVEIPSLHHRSTWFGLSAIAVRLDALAALGRRDDVEAETPQLLRPGTYLEPFALHALGVVREDEDLIRQAAERFDAMKLGWHAEQARALL